MQLFTDAIIMPSTTSLAAKLSDTYPHITFAPGSEFHWDPEQQMIIYDPAGNPALLLHELSHALLEHREYLKDVQLLEMEREAWEYAIDRLGSNYHVLVSEDIVENALDSYRDWLHARSSCPACSATGIQVKKYLYRCVACHEEWKVNDARSCALRRYSFRNTKNTRN